ncbi:MAG: hypothetical protein DDG60_08410 [Anaerolineae bacterium]|nr:MAG: hypothetical protein DDG60_08410 [Anaerolineae bacterium]
MPWIRDSLSVLGEQGSGLLLILTAASIGGWLMFGLLRQTLGEVLNPNETFVLSLIGWPFFWIVSAVLGFFINRWLEFGTEWAIFVFSLLGIMLITQWKKMPAPFGLISPLFIAACFGIFLLSLFTRLASLSGLLVPAYFDGVLHYQISKVLLQNFRQWPWEMSSAPVSGYYHIGFHLLTAAFAFVTNQDVIQVILLLGAFVLALVPFPVWLFVRRATGSTVAAIFALLLAGWGWDMPAHALNWGKYPAVLGLLAAQFVLTLAFTAVGLVTRRAKLTLLVLGVTSTLVATLIHSRAVVLILIAILSFLMARFLEKQPQAWVWVGLAVLVSGIIAITAYIETRPILRLVFDPYLRVGVWITALVGALLLFAVRHFRLLTITCLLVILGLLVALLLPIPSESFQTVLDRPFVQMTLYLPLAILAGLGLAGLRKEAFPGWQTALVSGAILCAAIISIGRGYPFSASPCCILFQADDAVAFDWIQKHLAPDAHILIAGNTLNVFDVPDSAELRGADGGVWLPLFTGRKVSLEHLSFDFRSPPLFYRLCERGITHIYVGSTAERFDLSALQSKPEWYTLELALPGTNLFRLTGCP